MLPKQSEVSSLDTNISSCKSFVYINIVLLEPQVIKVMKIQSKAWHIAQELVSHITLTGKSQMDTGIDNATDFTLIHSCFTDIKIQGYN